MRLIVGLSPRRPGFDHRSVRLRFVMGRGALEWFDLQVLLFSPVIIIPPIFHTHRHLHVAFTRRTNGRSLGIFQKAAEYVML
jgi:hypothetical protein